MITDKQIAEDVARGLELRATIQFAKDELKAITDRLEAAGLERPDEHQPLVDEDRTGRRWLANGRVPVVFESDLIIGSFNADSPLKEKLIALLAVPGKDLTGFFRRKVIFEGLHKSGKAFRQAAHNILGPTAGPFISACTARDKDGIPKSRTVIDWDDANL